jgi:Holliday junction resolvase-like predicted endonuclease
VPSGNRKAQLHDVVNQEVSFEKGRIDILATFGNRSQLVIVEVKAGEGTMRVARSVPARFILARSLSNISMLRSYCATVAAKASASWRMDCRRSS